MKKCLQCNKLLKDDVAVCPQCYWKFEEQENMSVVDVQQRQSQTSQPSQAKPFDNPIVKEELLKSLRAKNSKYSNLSNEELFKIVSAKSLVKLSSLEAGIAFIIFVSLLGGFIAIIN